MCFGEKFDLIKTRCYSSADEREKDDWKDNTQVVNMRKEIKSCCNKHDIIQRQPDHRTCTLRQYARIQTLIVLGVPYLSILALNRQDMLRPIQYSTVQSFAQYWMGLCLSPASYVIEVENVGRTGWSIKTHFAKQQPHHAAFALEFRASSHQSSPPAVCS
jgi:hypothetical protein